MSECEAYQEYVSAMLDGELSEEETRALRIHMENCPDCRAVSAAFTFIENALPGAFPEAPAGLHEHILSGVREAGPRRAPHSRRHELSRQQETDAPRQTKRRISPRNLRAAIVAAACLALVVTGAALSGRFLRMGRAGGAADTAAVSQSSGAAMTADAGGGTNGAESGAAFDAAETEEEMADEAPGADGAPAGAFAVEDAYDRLEGFESFTVLMDDETYEGEDAVEVVDEFFESGPTDKVLNLSVAFPGEEAYGVQLWYRGGKAVCSLNEDGVEVESLEDLLAYFRV